MGVDVEKFNEQAKIATGKVEKEAPVMADHDHTDPLRRNGNTLLHCSHTVKGNQQVNKIRSPSRYGL